VKGEVLSEAAAAMRAHQSQIEQTEQAIGELKDRNARSAERIEALTDSLGSVSRKLDIGTERLASLGGDLGALGRKFETEASGAQLLAERLGTVEKWIVKAHEREKARAELHARLADSLSPVPEG
jgi:chromosome segregation ATPase